MKKIAFLTVVIVFGFNFGFAGAFKDLGNGARAVSLGLSYVAIANNPYAMFYNPAGMTQIKKFGLATTYSRLYPFIQDEKLHYLTLSGVLPGFSIFDFGVGISHFKIGMWSENQVVLSVASGFKGLSVGGNLKFLRWSAVAPVGESNYSYFNFTFDAGAIFVWRDFINGSDLRFGMVLKNITQPSIAVNKSNDAKLPLEISGGVVYVSNSYNYLIGLGISKSEGDIKADIGVEILAFSSEFLKDRFEFILRGSGGAIVEGGRQSSLNSGFGIRYWKFKIDYVYVYQFEISDAGGSHKFSIEFNF
ncbi:hypothetical protein JGI7_00947 [Candidatus Kryptonium thompsonii]|uniref:PorV/PorQ family protein n=1 Tax=Candidatus Kryptonium thompsonii TaxID=1633631 RepID=A0A0N7MQM5_9BACT|nr:hypothetical protein [Candidatus Kryptonium thompsoni]CUS82259.1 hypothetical protein JGI13_00781 [Candidatus Kryptonium thompsoni]CUS83182.1 hypothetical protein JGI14_101420 [Candidatus Kryptonium thompsoni]CUS85864.1 hypothetical protein JGI7_00947 [Candidatus Kryptonium thompsoni]CUS89173.1 hypothetical protein JGI10_01521 [Candidatus Kryptonium thompsoni]CUS90643.1 hypothetical protein JGI6_01469 [Candidatus Kryptonium thompsoni]